VGGWSGASGPGRRHGTRPTVAFPSACGPPGPSMTVARLVLVSVHRPHTRTPRLPDAIPVWLNPLLPGRPRRAGRPPSESRDAVA
jgi:hypothetical protein